MELHAYRLAKNSGLAAYARSLQAFREGRRALGLVAGRYCILDERYADGHEARLPALVAELLSAGVRIIVATSQPSIAAAARVTKSEPVIGRMVDDSVTNGMAPSLARPGGNIIVIYTITEEMNPKRLTLLKEAVPALGRVSVLMRPDFPNAKDVEHAWQVAMATKSPSTWPRSRCRGNGSTMSCGSSRSCGHRQHQHDQQMGPDAAANGRDML